MMTSLRRIAFFLVLSLASLQSWACFAPPDAKPSNQLSELRLAEKPLDPAVVYTFKKYAIYLRSHDLLTLLEQKSYYSIEAEADLLRVLRSKLPLQADLTTDALIAPLAPRMPGAEDKERNDAVSLADRNFWARAEERLRFILADLLESGKASVVDMSTGEALQVLTLDRYNDVCSGGRRFISGNGELILRTMDWIS